MGGSSKKQTVGYKYYLGMHMILCHGPVDKLTRIEVDDRVAWEGEEGGGQIYIDKGSLFGGDSKEGGIKGYVDIEMGATTQGQNSYLVSAVASDVPGFRGVVGAVLRQLYLGLNPYLKAWSFRAQRIHKRTGTGATQWYDAKSEVSEIVWNREDIWKYKTENPGSPANYSAANYDDSGWSEGQGGFGNYAPGYNTPPAKTIIFGGTVPTTAGNIIWIRKTIGPIVNKDLILEAWHDDGAQIWVNGHAVTLESIDYFHSRTRIPAEYVSSTGNNVIAMKVTDSSPSGTATYIYAGIQVNGRPDMNPAHIIRECLTDPDWGLGYADSDIDSTSFTAAADTLYDEQLGMSLLWDRQKSIEDFIQDVVRHIDASLYVSRTTGKFVLKLVRDDYDVGDLITLDPSCIAKVANPQRRLFGELVNSVTVGYWNGITGKDATVTVTDTAMVQQQGQVINTTVQYPGFTTVRNATLAAQRDLRSLSTPFLSCTIYCDSTAKDLNIGDTFKFTWPRWQIQDKVMRVTGMAFGDGKSNQVRVTCTEDVFATPTVAVVSGDGSSWVDPSQPPDAVTEQIAEEVPYYELAQNLGQTAIDNTLVSNSEVGYVMAAAGKPGTAINSRLHTDAGTGYEDVGVLDFCPYGELTLDISRTQTSITLTNVSSLASIAVGSYAQIGEGDTAELVRVDSVNTTTNVITIGRGCLDTVPHLHSAGDAVYFWDAYNGYDPTEYTMSEVIDVKITPIAGQGELDIADAVAMSVTLNQRAYRPYAPGQFKINATYYPSTTLSGTLTVTWVDRDRTQQTSGTIYDHTAAAIGPEAGTTYRLRCYIDGVLDQTIEPATSGGTVTPTTNGLVRIEVDAKRDGVYSWQAASHEFLYSSGGNLRGIENDTNSYRGDEAGNVRVTED